MWPNGNIPRNGSGRLSRVSLPRMVGCASTLFADRRLDGRVSLAARPTAHVASDIPERTLSLSTSSTRSSSASQLVRSAINNALLSALARPALARFNRYLVTVGSRGLGIGHYGALVSDAEERFVRKLMASGLDGCVLDVGANEGSFSAFARSRNGTVPIYAFEPHPRTFARTAEVAAEKRFTAVNLAVGERPGTAELFDHAGQEGTGQASLHGGVIGSLLGGRAEAHPVEVTTLDAFAQERGIGRVLLLKIDTEGNELAVLKGARDLIARKVVAVVMFEFNAMNLVSRVNLKDFYETLPGFSFFRVLPKTLLRLGSYNYQDEVFEYQNIVAVSPEALEKLGL